MTRIVGSQQADWIDGTEVNDQMYGRGGNDSMYGWFGNDRLYGEAGDDYLSGADGRDRLDGGAGNDAIHDNFGDYNILIGGAGNDEIQGIGDLYGGAGDDTLYSSQGGGLQGSKLVGGYGHDTFSVGMDAASGATYDPSTGALIGLGASQKITIADFHHGSDKLMVSANDPLGNNFEGGQQTIGIFDSNLDGQLTQDDTYVSPTADGKGIELDFWTVRLAIDHVQSITAQDFLL